MIFRGTTPTFKLIIDDKDVDLTTADSIYVSFSTSNGTITKTGESLELSKNEVDVFLTQEETLRFPLGECKVQINWLYDDGKRACTTISSVQIAANLIEEVLE